MRIAFCDDDAAERQALQALLSAWSAAHDRPITLEVFGTGEALLQADGAQPFDAAILDIFMPGLGGVDTACRFRERHADSPHRVFNQQRGFLRRGL